MKAGNVGNVQNPYQQYQNTLKPDKNGLKGVEDLLPAPVDTYVPSVFAKDPTTLERLWNETNHVADAIRKLVASALGKGDATGQGFWAVRAGGGFKLSETDRAQAEQLISEDGFFGVKQTTARIMDFAKALIGEDASERDIENMRAAVQKGFNEVARMFGGFDKLPEVSKKTYEAIMKAFDEWLNGGAVEDETAESA